MSTIASLITSLAVVYSTVYSDADQRKHQSSASLAFVWGIHRDRWIPRTKGQLRGKMFPFDDVIMWNDNWHRFVWQICCWITHHCLLNSLFLDNTKENFKACIAGPMWGESSGDRWIPLTKCQWRGKYFHDMTSWWYKASFSARRRLAAESDILREKLDIRQDNVRTL